MKDFNIQEIEQLEKFRSFDCILKPYNGFIHCYITFFSIDLNSIPYRSNLITESEFREFIKNRELATKAIEKNIISGKEIKSIVGITLILIDAKKLLDSGELSINEFVLIFMKIRAKIQAKFILYQKILVKALKSENKINNNNCNKIRARIAMLDEN